MTATYVRFFTVGKILKEKKVGNRKIEGLEIPENCYGFIFLEREEYEAHGEIYYERFKNPSERYFLSKEFEGIKRIPEKIIEFKKPQKVILKGGIKQNLLSEDVLLKLP